MESVFTESTSFLHEEMTVSADWLGQIPVKKEGAVIVLLVAGKVPLVQFMERERLPQLRGKAPGVKTPADLCDEFVLQTKQDGWPFMQLGFSEHQGLTGSAMPRGNDTAAAHPRRAASNRGYRL